MPLIPEEPQIHESVPGPRATSAAGRGAPTPRPVPGPRPAPMRRGRPGPQRGPATPAPRAPRGAATAQAPASGPQIQLIPASPEGALDAADEAVDLLLDSGRAPQDILVLTMGDHHPWAAHELSFGEASYWAQHDAREDVFYTDASKAGRAADRPIVVVAVNGGTDATVADALPVAMRRAGVLLIICGDPERINTLVGVGV